MIFLAPAKVNLFLSITGKDKKDGHHFINSIFDPVSLYDILDIETLKSPAIKVKDALKKLKIKPVKNLVYRAARLLQKYCRVKMGASIALYKHIPDGAGLGGGSSGAAAVLLALNRMWGINMGVRGLKKLAFRLGSDVPFFIGGKPAFVSGKGEKIRPVKRRKTLWYVIVAAKGQKVRTPAAYKWYDRDFGLTSEKNTAILIPRLAGGDKSPINYKLLYNDFEEPVYSRKNKLRRVKQGLIKCKNTAGVSLSGSGSAVFALFEKKKHAVSGFKKAKRMFGGSFICLAHSI